MKTYDVVLTKAYSVRIKAVNEEEARKYCEFFTGDIQDISSLEDREKFNFKIEKIDCRMNETFEVQGYDRNQN